MSSSKTLSKFKSFEYSTTCTKGDAIDRFRNTVDLIDAGLERRVVEMYGYGFWLCGCGYIYNQSKSIKYFSPFTFHI